MLPAVAGISTVPGLVGQLLGWVLGVAALVPGRLGATAEQVRETAVAWGLPVTEVTDLYASFPVRLVVAAAAVVLVSATVVLVHALHERRRAQRRPVGR
ncbi:hypothetical protein [Cellulosimicrobium arenosum]|uniref:Uncharacterized protein n=1 Tax=Cellulosimicrobium arenosum TaxID=2708133 RepID=A0A927G8C5_9MICO|nr:hypothetical protein [Cellulosimicrobium arenosum]MBD8078778.1 hypothetical protein [Cellulosimicrobium arenosum]